MSFPNHGRKGAARQGYLIYVGDTLAGTPPFRAEDSRRVGRCGICGILANNWDSIALPGL